MAEKMELTPEERTKVEAINQKYADQMQPVLEGQMGLLARMGEVKKLEEAKDGELKAVLTPAQFQTYEASKDEMKERIEQRALETSGADHLRVSRSTPPCWMPSPPSVALRSRP